MHRHLVCVLTALILLPGLGSRAAAQSLLRVPQDTTSIQDAVNTVDEGGLVLVAPGDYAEVLRLGARSVSVVADGGPVRVHALQVLGLAAEDNLLVRGLDASLSGLLSLPAVELRNCAGLIRLEDVSGQAGDGFQGKGFANAAGRPGLQAVACDAVSLTRCQLAGGDGADLDDNELEFFTGNGGAGARVALSRVTFDECTLQGGQGGSVDTADSAGGGAGGHGLMAEGSALTVSGSELTAGSGGAGDCNSTACGGGGPGGSALVLTGDTSAWTRDLVLQPGSGGPDGDGLGAGDDGLPVVGSGQLDEPGPHRGLVVSGPLRAGETGTLTLSGAAGDQPLLLVSLTADYVPVPFAHGVLQVGLGGASSSLTPLPALPAGGQLSLLLAVPSIAPLQSLSVPVQAYLSNGDGLQALSSASSLIVLDPGL